MKMASIANTRRARRAPRPVVLLALALIAAALALPASGQAAQAPPTASTSGVSNVSYSSAILYGYINAKGAGTNYAFQYGTTSRYGAQSPLSPGGNATTSVRVSQMITGLLPETLYHYRVVAYGPAGIALGKDRTFTTPKIPLSLQLVGAPNPVVFGQSFYAEGTLSGTGGANHAIVLQVNPFPYIAGFKTVGNPELTNSVGGFSFPYLGLLETAYLRVVTVGSPVVVSLPVLEKVAVRVSFHVRRARRRGFVRLYGTVAPAEVGAQVGFQLLRPGNSVNEGGTTVRAGTAIVSRFSAVVRLRHRGLYRALIKVSEGAHVFNYSDPILIR
jgi:hypothetical protein